jgi:hypothetical protein
MKRFLARTFFVTTVLTVWLVLAAPVMWVLQAILAPRPGPDGLYPPGDGLLLVSALPVAFCLWATNRAVSRLFRLARITDERWTIFRASGRR